MMIPRPSPVAAALVLAGFTACAGAQMSPAGVWQTVDDDTGKALSLVRIVESGGVYSGRIEGLLDPARARSEPRCEKCTGELKDQPIVGLTILTGVRHSASDAALWDGGDILDPQNGKRYRVRLTPTDGGKMLSVRGYIGTPMFGRTQTWIRVE